MTDHLLLSKFETYLLDEDDEIELKEQYDMDIEEKLDDKKFPEGFFTSL